MTAFDPEETHLALRGVLLEVAELPAARGWENVDFVPPLQAPSVDDRMGPWSTVLLSLAAAGGHCRTTGLYIVRVFGIANQGDAPVRTITTAIVNAFPLGGRLGLPSGLTARIEGESGVDVSQILPTGKNKTQCTVSIPWAVLSQNPAQLDLAS